MKRRDEPLPDAADVKKAYQALPRTDVPAEVDARILARARDAASKSGNVLQLKLRAMRHWAIPITAAASVVVVSSVVYETKFSTPHEASVAAMSMQQSSPSLAEDRALAPAAPEPETAANKPAAARAKQRADSARANSIRPLSPVIGPVINSPVIVSLADSAAPAPFAPELSSPMSAPISGTVANESRREKGDETKELESKKAEGAAGMMTAPAQLLGKVEKPPEPPILAPLVPLAGHYTYEIYRVIMLSGEARGLKELGATAATLDIDAQGTLTRRITMTDGKVTTQIGKVLEVKVDGYSGYWIAQWPDTPYPVETTISLEGGKLASRTQFEDLSDKTRFGSVELARLRREQ